MTKKKTDRIETEPVVAPKPVHVDGPSAEAALAKLRSLRPGPVTVTTTLAKAQETVVVEGHAFHGSKAGAVWRFDPASFRMACRVAGWSTVDYDGSRWRLS